MRAVILFLIAKAACAQFAGIDGIAIDTTTKKPLAGVHLLMFSLGTESGVRMPGAAYGALTKADGSYSIRNMAPGGYILMPQRAGFVYMPGEKTAGLTLKPGEQVNGYTLQMTPRAVITGRVLDEFGEPAPRIQVEGTAVGTQQPMSSSMNATTNERGEYKLIGAPGKYYVKANLRQFGAGNGAAEIRTDGSVAMTYGPAQSPLVEVGPGEDVGGIDLRLTPQHSLTVRGTISGLSHGGMQRAVVALLGTDGSLPFGTSQYIVADANGQFTFSGVRPGAYRCFARVDGTPRMFSPMADLRVESADQTVGLKVSSGEEFSGTVDAAGVRSEKMTIHLEPASPLDSALLGVNTEAEIATDGSFRIGGVFPTKLRVRIDPLPEDAYVKSIRIDDAEMKDTVLDFSRGVTGSRIRVAVSPNGAQISGRILDKDGMPLQSPFARVYVVGATEEISLFGLNTVKSALANGTYTARGIRPGKYRVLVVDALRITGNTEDTKKLFDAAEVVELKEGDHLVKDLKVMTAESTNAK